jgi:hypothetical protein
MPDGEAKVGYRCRLSSAQTREGELVELRHCTSAMTVWL